MNVAMKKWLSLVLLVALVLLCILVAALLWPARVRAQDIQTTPTASAGYTDTTVYELGFDELPRGGEKMFPASKCMFLVAEMPQGGIATYGGSVPVLYFYAMTTGDTALVKYRSWEFDVARVYYMLPNLNIRDNLWVAFGWQNEQGNYYPMNDKQPWSRQEGLDIFGRPGIDLYLTLAGFNINDSAVDWLRCRDNGSGMCRAGLAIDIAGHGGTSVFLDDYKVPENWFMFGWMIDIVDFMPDQYFQLCTED